MYRKFKILSAFMLFLVIIDKTAPYPVRNFDLPNHHSCHDMKIYFDRADFEKDDESWFYTVFMGFDSLPATERDAAETELARRFGSWKMRQIENKLPSADIEALLGEIEDKNIKYLYETENEKPVFDSRGDPQFKKISGLEEDKKLWDQEIRSALNRIFEEWEQKAFVVCDELSFCPENFPDNFFYNFSGNFPEDIDKRIAVSFREYREKIKKEFEYIFTETQKNFLTKRSFDSFSLKKKNENNSASSAAGDVVSEIKKSLAEAKDILKKDLNLISALPEEKIDTRISAWEENFNTEFQRGIKKWETAEKSFLTERLRWDYDARESYINAEEKWDKETKNLIAARDSWLSEMTFIMEEGRDFWREEKNNFLESHEISRRQLEEASKKEIERFSKEADMLLSIYRKNRSLEETASVNISWLKGEIDRINRWKCDKQSEADRYGSGIRNINREIDACKKRLESGNKDNNNSDDEHRGGSFNISHIIAARLLTGRITELEAQLPDLQLKFSRAFNQIHLKDGELAGYVTEHAYWSSTAGSCREAMNSAESELLSLERRIEEGLYGRDEFEIELELLREKQGMLCRQLEIAQAVYDYSIDHTSQRERRADSEENYRAALVLAGECEKKYNLLIDELDLLLTTGLAAGEENIIDRKKKLEEADFIYQEAKTEYENSMELFRLKDSSLLQCSIENLREEIDSFYESERYEAWNEYFLSREKSLRDETAENSSELLADLLGLSQFDNVENLETAVARRDSLYMIEPDFSDPASISDLKIKLSLLKIDMESDNFKSLESCVQEERSEDALFYWEKIKLNEDCIVRGKETAIALLQGDYIENPLLACGSADFPGDEISTRDLLLLDAEREAVSIWRPLSSAYIDSERSRLAAELREILGIIETDDEIGSTVCFTSGLEDEEDITELFNLVFDAGAPDYIVEILINMAALEIRLKNIEIVSDVSEEIDDTGAVNAAKICMEKSKYINEGYREKTSLEKILLLSVASLSQDEALLSGSGNEKKKRESALALEKSAAAVLTKLASLEDKLVNLENETAASFKNNVELLKIELEEKKSIFDEALYGYEQSLSDFTSLAQSYQVKKSEADNAFTEYRDASEKLQLAQEIMDFALSPYQLPETDPLSVLQKRKEEYERARDLYETVKSIMDSERKKDYKESFDPFYIALLEKKSETLGSLNYLSACAAQLGRDIMIFEEKAGILCSQIADAVNELFRFDSRFVIPDDGYHEITDFTGCADKAASISASERYFALPDADSIYSRDTWSWMKSVFNRGSVSGSEILRNFGIAFYSEYKDKVNVAVYSDQNYCTLKKGKYADCNPEHYTDAHAASVLENIKNDRNFYLPYCFFRTMMLSGRIAFDTSFIGKDAGHIAHDYLWDESKKEEKRIKKKHPISNFFKRTASKMSTMRHNMADINGNEERSIISHSAAEGFEKKKKLDACKEKIAELTGRDTETGSVISFSSVAAGMEKAAGKAPLNTGSCFLKDLEALYLEMDDKHKSNCYAAAEQLVFEYERKIAELNESLFARALFLESQRDERIANLRVLKADNSVSADDIRREYIDLYYNPSWSMKEGASGEYEFVKESAFVDFTGKERLLASGNSSAVNLLTACMINYIKQKEKTMESEYLQIQKGESKWQERMRELYRCGTSEWEKSFGELTGQRKRWQEEYSAAALRMEELWSKKYSTLVSGRKEWINEFSSAAAKGAGETLAKKTGLRVDELISASDFILIPDLRTNEVDLDSIVVEITDNDLLSSLAETAKYHTAKSKNEKISISSCLPDLCMFTGTAFAIENYQKNITEEIRKRGALITALKTAKIITETEDVIRNNIDTANKSTGKQLSDTLEGKGYRRRGNLFSRSAIIDISLLGGIESERQEIEGYRYFSAPGFDPGVDLGRDSLISSGAHEIELKIEKSGKNLSRYAELVFGKKESGDSEKWIGFDQAFLEYTKRMEERYKASSRYEEFKNLKGLFYIHLGYAPLMNEKKPEKVKKEGYGEYGRIYELFLINEARLGRGLAAIEQPWYSQKMWDDDKNNDGKSDTLIGAPSARSAAGIAMSIASGGAGLFTSLALNMADDAVFTALDVKNGITEWDEGLLWLGKSSASSLASAAIAGAGRPAYTESSFISAAAKAGLRSSGSNLASAGINSFALNSDGLYFDLNDFGKNSKNSILGAGAMAGYISSMGSAALDSGLTGFYGDSLKKGKALDSTIASSAASLWEYGSTGKTTLNLLNSSDFGFGNTGLLELGIGDGGSFFDIGMEGQNVSDSNLAASVKGLDVWHQNARIYASRENNIRENAVSMRSLYSNRQDKASAVLYENFLSGKDKLLLDDTIEGSAKTLYNESRGGRDILVRSKGSGIYSSLELSVLLGHEAHRDGINRGSAAQMDETVKAVLAHTLMAGDIGREYKGFAESNPHLAAEVKLLYLALESGNAYLFDSYAASAYNRDSDNYFPDFRDFGLKQNSGTENSVTTLGYDESEVNGERFEVQYQKYLKFNKLQENEFGKEKFIALWQNEEQIRDAYKIKLYKNESISKAGCNLYTLLYMQQTLTGNKIEGKEANEILKKEKQFAEGNLLLTDSSKALGILTEGKYSFSFKTLSTEDYSDNTIIRMLEEGKYSTSPESVRISTGTHFMVLKDFKTIIDKEGSKVISEIEVLNPLKGGRTIYRGNEIKRFDFFRAYKSKSYADEIKTLFNGENNFTARSIYANFR
ncbi:MAG: hypothetical protein RBT69_03085 [Spirochaetia bacterium]|jgi:hypothetical protein|nr:hypothetical protein [Spirochaetia bacterium]